MDLFFIFNRDDADPPKILLNTSSLSTKPILNTDITSIYNSVRFTIDNSTDPNIKYILNNYSKIMINNQYYLWEMLKFDIENTYNILSNDFEKDFYITHITGKGSGFEKVGSIKTVKTKYKNILYNAQSELLSMRIANLDRCAREIALFRNKIHTISYLFDFLEIGGSFFLSIHGFCDDRIIELYYVLATMFRKCVVYNTTYILCTDFDPRDIITKADVLKLLDNHYSVDPKPHLTKFVEYIHTNLTYHTRKFQILLTLDENEFLNMIMNEVVNSIKYTAETKNFMSFMIQYNASIIENLKRVFIGGRLIKVNSAINGAEGKFIRDILLKYKAVNCLEVGMAYGISAFYMLLNPAVRLISIDPFQSTQWHNYGVKLLAEFKFNTRHQLYPVKSYIALPQILAEMGPGIFDFIFIDGFHTFDYTLVDFFYANLLTKVGGIIVIDDALHAGVAKCVKYIDSNYSFFKRLVSPSTIAVYLKMREDPRDWDYHRPF